jgi:ssRNA-specific RNase YbeY (16S rRNA maturation enzyme)
MGLRATSSDRVGDVDAGRFAAADAAETASPLLADREDDSGASSSIYLPPYRVDITTRCHTPLPVSRRRLAEAMHKALEAAGAPGPASVGLVLSDDADLARLNALHMGVRWTVVEEMLLLTIHGTLHVCGWDHTEPVEEAAMRALERKVMACLAEGDCEDDEDVLSHD